MELLEAAKMGDAACVARYMEQDGDASGVGIDHVNEYGSTALLLASWQGHRAIVSTLLAAGANVRHANNYGSTALAHASQYGHVDIVDMLLEAGADVDHADNDGDTALHLAAKGFLDVVRLLLHAGANPCIRNKTRLTALSNAEQKRQSEIIQVLRTYDRSALALFGAVRRGDLQVMNQHSILNQHKNARGFYDRTPLHIAAKFGRLDALQLLVARGAKLHDRDVNGWTALHFASRRSDAAIVALLLSQGCDPNVVDSDERSPVMVAASEGHVDVMQALIAAGGSLSSSSGSRTVLHHAASHHQSTGVVELLLRLDGMDGVDIVNTQDATGSSALHLAACAGNVVSVVALLEHGAHADAHNHAGESALFLASKRGDANIVRVLLEQGVRTDLATCGGQTPLSVARGHEIQSVLQLYHNSQQFHARCAQLLSASDAMTTLQHTDKLCALVPLITSVYDLRLFLPLVSLCGDADDAKNDKNENENDVPRTADRRTVLKQALSHIVATKLVLDDHACVFFKLVLDHCRANAWLSPSDLHLLDRRAENVNTESAEWVVELKRKVHEHGWRLDKHDQCLQRVVDAVRRVHTVVQANRTAVESVRHRVDHLQSHVAAGKKLMGQLIRRGNSLAGNMDQLQQRLAKSERNVVGIAEELQSLRRTPSSRFGHSGTKSNTRKITSGVLAAGGLLLAAVGGFIFGPLLTDVFDAVIDLADPVEIYQLAYTERDMAKFMAHGEQPFAMVPVVARRLETLAIPMDAFETLLRHELVLRHPDLVSDSTIKRFNLGIAPTEYVKKLGLSLQQEADAVDQLLSELQTAIQDSTTTDKPLESLQFVSRYATDGVIGMADVTARSQEEDHNNHHDVEGRVKLAPPRPPRPQEMECVPKETTAAAVQPLVNLTSERVVFLDELTAFPYHAAVHGRHDSRLSAFCELLRVGNNDDPMAAMAMRLDTVTTSRESLCAVQYAYSIGNCAVGDWLVDHWASSPKKSTKFDRTPAISVELLEPTDDFAYICIVDESQGDVDDCALLCELVHEEDHALEATIHATVVRVRSEEVTWTAVEYASHLGLVEIVKYLLKETCRSMATKAKIQTLRHAQKRAAQLNSSTTDSLSCRS